LNQTCGPDWEADFECGFRLLSELHVCLFKVKHETAVSACKVWH